MKFIVSILFFAFLSIALTPLALMYAPIPEMICSEGECCMAEEDTVCDIEDMECCPPGTCNAGQCVFCCFTCTISHDKIVIKVFDTGIKIHSAADQFLLSDFTSECFQPPELA